MKKDATGFEYPILIRRSNYGRNKHSGLGAMCRTCKACGDGFDWSIGGVGRVNAVMAASLLVLE